MKNMTRKFLAAGLLATALTFVGCKSNTSAEQGGTTTDQGTTTPAEGTGTGTDTGGTGGAGTDDISTTKQSDDNLRHPENDWLRTPEQEGIRESESEDERGAHDNNAGTGGSGFGTEATEEPLNEGGNIGGDTRIPDSPADTLPEDVDNSMNEGERPDDMR
jgi:hypothetical protein